MMDCTDRHCRYFHRQLSQHALLYSEMIVDRAIIFGDRESFLKFNPIEHPVALQLGGNDPKLYLKLLRLPWTLDMMRLTLMLDARHPG